ncbi:c-type cytochrome [Paracoccus sanguinis]|uniref:c-type cytochrome n=1 Tax=Paracoccus sanguinis TaxID=1545044 RepID=UPI00068E4542|nr:cytochrome c family protein [Paracoccus sanguinis]
MTRQQITASRIFPIPTRPSTGAGLLFLGAAALLAHPAPLAAQDGEKLFKLCATCHTVTKDGAKKVGPNLWGVVNRPAASVEGFKYSKSMQERAGQPWTPELLEEYLAAPKTIVPGTTMSFAGMKKPEERKALVAWLGQQSDNPVVPAAAVDPAQTTPAPADAETTTPAASVAPGTARAEVAVETAPGTAPPLAENPAPETLSPGGETPNAGVARPEGAPEVSALPQGEIVQVEHRDPPGETDAEIAAIGEKLAALKASLPGMDYQRARYHPIHFQPAIATSTDSECLACHKEILNHKVAVASPAGLRADSTIAWYQTLDTYMQDQQDFHWRHMESDFAKATMKLTCNFCHKGNDPREESPDMMPGRHAFSSPVQPEFTNRKMVNPSETCLRCHGQMPDPVNIMGLGGPWPEVRADMEDPTSDDPTLANGCLSCHAETFRTNRHNVTYLNAASIEDLAQAGSDTCYGCHGGRAWFRTSYPYPRTAWPGMDTETVPDWALGRQTRSDVAWRMPDSDPTPGWDEDEGPAVNPATLPTDPMGEQAAAAPSASAVPSGGPAEPAPVMGAQPPTDPTLPTAPDAGVAPLDPQADGSPVTDEARLPPNNPGTSTGATPPDAPPAMPGAAPRCPFDPAEGRGGAHTAPRPPPRRRPRAPRARRIIRKAASVGAPGRWGAGEIWRGPISITRWARSIRRKAATPPIRPEAWSRRA